LRDFCESGKIGEKWANGAKLLSPYLAPEMTEIERFFVKVKKLAKNKGK
jgi:hypothetical protein